METQTANVISSTTIDRFIYKKVKKEFTYTMPKKIPRAYKQPEFHRNMEIL